MTEFISFFVVLAAALFFPVVFSRVHVPWVVALIVGGILLGPNGVGFFELNETLLFLGEIGLVFLMFAAGLETRVSGFDRGRGDLFKLALLNGLGPFVMGVGVGVLLGLSMTAALLLGTALMSTSVGVVIPALERQRLLGSRVGRVIVGGTVLEDVLSLVILSLLLQTSQSVANVPLWLYYPLVVMLLLGLRWLIPRVRWLLTLGGRKENVFQEEVRFLLVTLIGVVVVFELLGLHPILAGFFAGWLLAGTVKHEVVQGKLKVVSYGLFIPIFFVAVGARADLAQLWVAGGGIVLTVSIVVLGVVSKFFTGWL